MIFRVFGKFGSWLAAAALVAFTISLLRVGVFASVVFAIPAYFLIVNIFSQRVFLDDHLLRSKPLHFLGSKRKKIYLYEDLLKVKLTYNVHEGKTGYFFEFVFKRKHQDLFQTISENEPKKILALLTHFMEKRVPVFVVNETKFLKGINKALKDRYNKAIDSSAQVSDQHTFFFLKNDEE